ncbi:haloacid dehalogenase-like hydrolase domain-containing 5 [Styela clava]|uniref:haloacid dehalogenase-like hydrolase domain-containing 5 n=1 Tax=Styela clava TaxID=7725 RepID=UPI001939BDF6|nr:haloacid dehalogenase-like hydrolase domain-containing 5 [Styela clava]
MGSQYKDLNNNASNKSPQFGIMFDIDGVLLRGKTPIPQASESLKSLLDETGTRFAVPAVFCTNGFGLREVKAATLSEKLGVEVNPDQIVMSQNPLEMFHEYHDKWCLVSGPEHDGGSVKVAESLGFQKILTIEDVRKAYPYLDWVDRARWPKETVDDDDSFPTIEAVVLLGEPVRWETNLQLILDVLLTNGKPNRPGEMNQRTHLPVLAVNMDLLWMAKAQTPRFGHGAFLVCLENLYKKITGSDLEYTALIGKPSEVTYEYSQKLIEEIATSMNITELTTVYAIGDNPLTDIYGANMFNKFLQRKRKDIAFKKEEIKKQMEKQLTRSPVMPRAKRNGISDRSAKKAIRLAADNHIALHGDITNVRGVNRCTSILVCTGVYKAPEPGTEEAEADVDHGHRDLPYTAEMTKADYIVEDVKNAIDTIFRVEKWKPLYG